MLDRSRINTREWESHAEALEPGPACRGRSVTSVPERIFASLQHELVAMTMLPDSKTFSYSLRRIWPSHYQKIGSCRLIHPDGS